MYSNNAHAVSDIKFTFRFDSLHKLGFLKYNILGNFIYLSIETTISKNWK